MSITDAQKIACWNMVEALRAQEAHSVELLPDNADFNGQPNCAVICTGEWTGWNEERFTGDTMFDALSNAHDEKMKRERARLETDA